ncbi:MAG: PTS sugar transporter subunit IIA [Phycisphaerales bacterium]
MALEPYIRPELTFVLDGVESKSKLFELMAQAVDELVEALDGETLQRRLEAREEQMATSTPEGVAFPHALAPEIDKTFILAARLKSGVDFGVPDHPKSDLIFCMFGSSKDPWEHIRLLARLARIVRSDEARSKLRGASDAADLYQRLLAEDRSHG